MCVKFIVENEFASVLNNHIASPAKPDEYSEANCQNVTGSSIFFFPELNTLENLSHSLVIQEESTEGVAGHPKFPPYKLVIVGYREYIKSI